MMQFISLKKSDAVLLAEVNTVPEKMQTYLGNGTRMQMLFNFYANQHLFLSLAKEDAAPLIAALQSLPALEPINQWLNFLRHHDELSLTHIAVNPVELVGFQ
jgi:maltose alpha-D-glucosyltransferase/alpha-amylase